MFVNDEEYKKDAERRRELKNIEKIIRKDILEPFDKRYFSWAQKEENKASLVNLINYKMKLNLNGRDCNFIINTYLVEKHINLFSKELSRLKNPDINSLANIFLKLSPEMEADRMMDGSIRD